MTTLADLELHVAELRAMADRLPNHSWFVATNAADTIAAYIARAKEQGYVDLEAKLAASEAAIAQAYEDGRISACNAGKPGCPRVKELEAKLAASEAACAQMREALGWYGEEAKAIAKHMAKGAHVRAEAILASVTVLSLDGGRRADAAIAASKPKEPKP